MPFGSTRSSRACLQVMERCRSCCQADGIEGVWVIGFEIESAIAPEGLRTRTGTIEGLDANPRVTLTFRYIFSGRFSNAHKIAVYHCASKFGAKFGGVKCSVRMVAWRAGCMVVFRRKREWGMEYFRLHTRDLPQCCPLAGQGAIVNRPNVTENRYLGEVTSAKLTFRSVISPLPNKLGKRTSISWIITKPIFLYFFVN